MVEQLSNQKSWKPWQGIVYLVGAFVILIASSLTLQAYLGMLGLVLSQLLFLGYAVVVTKLHKTPLKEVFPIKMITFKEFFGLLIFTLGAISANLSLASLGMIIFPQGLQNVESTSEFLFGNGLPPVLIVLIVSLTPAICEEALMRGGFLSHFRGLKNEWAVMAIVGAGFGLLHTSTVKFLCTGFLGALLAYLVIRKKNILLASMVHFLNNFLSSLVGVLSLSSDSSSTATTAASSSVDAVSTANPVSLFATVLVLGCVAPILLYTGAVVMGAAKNKGSKFAIAGILSAVMLIAGVGLNLYTASANTVASFQTTSSFENSDEIIMPFDISEDGTYQIVMSGTLDKGSADIEIIYHNGEIVTTDKIDSTLVVFNQTIELKAGKYEINIVDSDGNSGNLTLQVQVIKV